MANEQERDDSMTAESWGRMEKAIIVMGHELEIPREIVLPILKKLYQAYEGEWSHIEADGYRLLADMIFQHQENAAACCDPEDKKMEPGSSRGLKKTLKKQCPARVNPPRQVARRACKKLEIDESSETSTSQDSDERDDPHRSLDCDATRKTEGDQHAIAMVPCTAGRRRLICKPAGQAPQQSECFVPKKESQAPHLSKDSTAVPERAKIHANKVIIPLKQVRGLINNAPPCLLNELSTGAGRQKSQQDLPTKLWVQTPVAAPVAGISGTAINVHFDVSKVKVEAPESPQGNATTLQWALDTSRAVVWNGKTVGPQFARATVIPSEQSKGSSPMKNTTSSSSQVPPCQMVNRKLVCLNPLPLQTLAPSSVVGLTAPTTSAAKMSARAAKVPCSSKSLDIRPSKDSVPDETSRLNLQSGGDTGGDRSCELSRKRKHLESPCSEVVLKIPKLESDTGDQFRRPSQEIVGASSKDTPTVLPNLQVAGVPPEVQVGVHSGQASWDLSMVNANLKIKEEEQPLIVVSGSPQNPEDDSVMQETKTNNIFENALKALAASYSDDSASESECPLTEAGGISNLQLALTSAQHDKEIAPSCLTGCTGGYTKDSLPVDTSQIQIPEKVVDSETHLCQLETNTNFAIAKAIILEANSNAGILICPASCEEASASPACKGLDDPFLNAPQILTDSKDTSEKICLVTPSIMLENDEGLRGLDGNNVCEDITPDSAHTLVCKGLTSRSCTPKVEGVTESTTMQCNQDLCLPIQLQTEVCCLDGQTHSGDHGKTLDNVVPSGPGKGEQDSLEPCSRKNQLPVVESCEKNEKSEKLDHPGHECKRPESHAPTERHFSASQKTLASPCTSSGSSGQLKRRSTRRNSLRSKELMSTEEGQRCHDTVTVQSHDLYDLSRGKEMCPVSFVDVSGSAVLPQNFLYIQKSVVYQNAHTTFSLARIGEDDCCVGCTGNCLDSPLPCACARLTDGEYAYTVEGRLYQNFIQQEKDKKLNSSSLSFCQPGLCPYGGMKDQKFPEPCKGHVQRRFIKECWEKCGCTQLCGNRVVQRGLTRKLQVFWTPEGKGWGLRSLQDLPAGTFVCEFAGEILTNLELYERNTGNNVQSMHHFAVQLDADWCSERFLKDEEALCLDGTWYGNVARFINHRCFDTNLLEVPVEIESPDHHYYHLAFFTSRDVKVDEELTWDYGLDFNDKEHPIKAFKCLCGSDFCRGKAVVQPT